MRRPQLELFCQEHGLKMCSIADLISYRLKREQFVRRIESIQLPTQWGDFQLYAYQSVVDPQPHLALTKGGIGDLDKDGNPIVHEEPVLVRVHSECLTGDIFGSARCDCGPQLSVAMRMIEKEGKGVLVYLRQEGRGIGLANKFMLMHCRKRDWIRWKPISAWDCRWTSAITASAAKSYVISACGRFGS